MTASLRPVHLCRLLIALLLSLGCLGTAQAQIKIRTASYGRLKPERSVDVKQQLENLLNQGTTAFRVGPSLFGFNPNPGRANFLVVEYEVYGQKAFGRAEDGDRFAFKGVSSGPSYPPSGGGGDRVRFENAYGRVIYLYELSRWGSWEWKAQLDPGAVYASPARPGDRWAVTDRAGRTLQTVTVPRGLGLMRLR